MVDAAAIGERVRAVLPGVLDDLVHLVSIPSVSSQSEHAGDVAAAADTVVGHLKVLGCDRVRVVQSGGQPAVIAHFDVAPELPTVCLYAHLDVQPTGVHQRTPLVLGSTEDVAFYKEFVAGKR